MKTTTHTATARAIGYVRVSTTDQADHGVSLDAQEAKIRAMVAVQDAELVGVIHDAGASAKNLNRSGLVRLLELVDAGEVDTVIVAKLDRLTRSVRDLADLLDRFNRRNVALVSVAESLDTGSAAGRLVLNIMASVSQWEREAIGERTREALRHKKAQGQRVGTVAYGFRLSGDGVSLIENPAEAETLATIRRMREGGRTLQAIADYLNSTGRRTRRGTAWSIATVHHLSTVAA